MPDRPWNILLVEDDEEDYLLTREMLSEIRDNKYILEWKSTYEEGKQAILEGQYDAILMDYELGSRTGLDLTREVTSLGCRIPIILLTGRGNYDVDIEAMQIGVAEYVSKSDATTSSLDRAIRYTVLQKQTEEELRAAKEYLETRVQERTRELTQKNAALEAEITERERIEAELAEVQRRLLDRAENERLEFARDLHDGPMQDLYGLIFALDTLTADLPAVEGAGSIGEIKEKILQIIQSLRTISRELRPPALAPYGLEKAIRSHADALMQVYPDLRIELNLEEDGQTLPESVRLALFRIYQTAITNVIRHAQATHAEVRLVLNDNETRLEIHDNGRGFKVPDRWIGMARGGHLGLVGATERAEAVGGKLKVESRPGHGTHITVIVPRNQPTQPD